MASRNELKEKFSLWKTILDLTSKLAKAKPRSDALYQAALSFLGTDASPYDQAPDMVGCADSVSAVIQKVLPGFPTIVSTLSLYLYLKNDPRFREVSAPVPGAIIISPTGMSDTKKLANGHTGICGEGNKIMSNNSYKGLWEQNYTTETWRARYEAAGYPIFYFVLK